MNNVLVMLQTNSNQAYIYSSPRLREQIGASFQITLLSQWVDEEAKKLLEVAEGELPDSFWVSRSSGKVIVRLTGNDGEPKALARSLIGAVTRRAFEKAPGLDVTGVFTPPEDADGTHNGMTDDEAVTQDSLDALDREFNAYSLNRPPAAARFPQLPFLERGAESALPAAHKLSPSDLNTIRERAGRMEIRALEGDVNNNIPTQTDHDAALPLSLPSRVKRAWSRAARRHQLQDVLRRWPSNREGAPRPSIKDLFEDPFQLERAFQGVPASEDGSPSDVGDSAQNTGNKSPVLHDLSSVGVIHIDGNGVGAVMRDLQCAYYEVRAHLSDTKFKEIATEGSGHNPADGDSDEFQRFIMEVNDQLDEVVRTAVARAWADVASYANPITDGSGSDNTPSHAIPDDGAGTGDEAEEARTRVPIVPVLVGGDDLTVYIAGDYAIPFAESYIRHYESLTWNNDLLKRLVIVANKDEVRTPRPGPLTASAGVAIVGRNFPFHIAYDLAEKLVSRGKKLGKKKGEVQCSTLDFHILRDTTVLDPDDTLTEYKDRTQRPFLIGHYSEERITGTAHAEPGAADGIAGPSANGGQWKQILRAVAAFNGQDPDQPGASLTDSFPRTRANRIIKLLAEGDEGKALSEWKNALENTSAAQRLYDELRELPPRVPPRDTSASHGHKEGGAVNAPDSASTPDAVAPAEPSSQAEETPSSDSSTALEHIKWLLDILDLAENLPAGYVQAYSALHETGLGEDAASTSGEPETPRPNDDPRSTPSPDEGASK
ncbi:hypothetical protein QU668_06590 [Schaalia sp. HMT-877]|nr:hypothetical protein HMPREF1550_00272 [Actinomyces sp. oral taxon 877 str. F0543]WLD79222.1 hypothetical protein QU668_06590 [Schaalia sp. HMT-877]